MVQRASMKRKYPKPSQYRNRWRVRWFDENDERQSETFDTYAEAEAYGKKMFIEAEEIKSGIRSPRPIDKTCSEVFDYWLKHRAVAKRSRKDDISIIEKHFRPMYGAIRIREFGVQHADMYVQHRPDLNPKTIHNHLTLLISILRLAHDLKWVSDVPRIKKPKIIKDTDFFYLRNEDEIRRFLASARQESELIFTMYATAIYSGLRAGELAGLTWGDINFETKLITVQRSYSGPTKSGEVRYVPIFDVLLPLLRNWKLQCPDRYVFPNRNGTMQGKSARIFQEVLHRVLKRAELLDVDRRGKLRHYIVFHDLRHTFASLWMTKAGDIYKLQKMLGHVSVETTMQYAHLSPQAYKEDLNRFGGYEKFQQSEAEIIAIR